MDSNPSKVCYFPNLINILEILTVGAKDNNLKQNKNNKFVNDCLNSIDKSVEQRKYYLKLSIIDLLSYFLFLLYIRHCLFDGNKRFFSIFLLDFIKSNGNIILQEFWTELNPRVKAKLILDLFQTLEEERRLDKEDEIIQDYIKLWIQKLIIFN